MDKPYHETLPEDYFNNLYQKISRNLVHGENVCLSAMPGCGARTSLNFLESLFNRHRLFTHTCVVNPEFTDTDVVETIRAELVKTNPDDLLVIIPSFDLIEDKLKVLSRLDALRRNYNKSLVFLAITDPSAVTQAENYTTEKSIFFSEVIYLSPFDRKESDRMIESLGQYYGWKVPTSLYPVIYKLSGGIPRLIKYLCKERVEAGIDLTNLECLTHPHQINFQLRNLTKILISVPRQYLSPLGLIEKNKIKSSLLHYYFKNYISEKVKEIFPRLSISEAKILSYFLENKSRLMTLDKLADIINMSDEDFSLWALYKKISRLKEKIKSVFLIKNVKGLGYVLENVNEV